MKEKCGNFQSIMSKVIIIVSLYTFYLIDQITVYIINNVDIDESEANIPYYDHVFLESYLEKFPQLEPIQQFMTLVLNGISHNSFLNFNEKMEIIEWYKNYFDEKLDLINEALEAERLEKEYFAK